MRTCTERSTWGKWNPFAPRVNNLDLAVKIISSWSKRKMHCWQIIHLTQKIIFLPQEQYIWFQTIFVLRQEDFHKRIFLLPMRVVLIIAKVIKTVWSKLSRYSIFYHMPKNQFLKNMIKSFSCLRKKTTTSQQFNSSVVNLLWYPNSTILNLPYINDIWYL